MILEINKGQIKINETVIKIWMSSRQLDKKAHESFGVLIGKHSDDHSKYSISSVTTPANQDQHTRSSFLLKDEKHQEVVDRIYQTTSGEQGYLGTWHTHPENNPTPSTIDIKDWEQCIQRNLDRKLLFVIVGLQSTNIYFNNHSQVISFANEDDVE